MMERIHLAVLNFIHIRPDCEKNPLDNHVVHVHEGNNHNNCGIY